MNLYKSRYLEKTKIFHECNNYLQTIIVVSNKEEEKTGILVFSLNYEIVVVKNKREIDNVMVFISVT